MLALPDDLQALLSRAADGLVVVMTGAGISAESGIPTFRGEEGYWKVGSRNYRAQELATFGAYSRMPDEVWAWYLYRRSVCQAAAPNPGHEALVALEAALGDRFLLVTQNVDGLHLRAGNSHARTYQIHGNIDFMRCGADCCPDTFDMPAGVDLVWPKGRAVGDAERALLVCPKCGGRARPHVLWFDETYDEPHFRFESSLRAASQAGLLIVVGTSGATTLPHHVAGIVSQRGTPFVALNLDASPFTDMADHFWQGPAGERLPPITEHLIALAG